VFCDMCMVCVYMCDVWGKSVCVCVVYCVYGVCGV